MFKNFLNKQIYMCFNRIKIAFYTRPSHITMHNSTSENTGMQTNNMATTTLLTIAYILLHPLWDNAIRMKAVLMKFSKISNVRRFQEFNYLQTRFNTNISRLLITHCSQLQPSQLDSNTREHGACIQPTNSQERSICCDH